MFANDILASSGTRIFCTALLLHACSGPAEATAPALKDRSVRAYVPLDQTAVVAKAFVEAAEGHGLRCRAIKVNSNPLARDDLLTDCANEDRSALVVITDTPNPHEVSVNGYFKPHASHLVLETIADYVRALRSMPAVKHIKEFGRDGLELAAADPIPPHLVGVWVAEGSVLRGPLLLSGQALYLGADGIGAQVAGPPPIGVKIAATFTPATNRIEFDWIEGGKVVGHGSIGYHAETQTIDTGGPQPRPLHRRFSEFSDEVRKALGF
ncbi:MAG: hypothetical protein HYX47_13755 [Burkholderiales bacterium]|nr:hypothetical protein [Burkholderiales bacterium]